MATATSQAPSSVADDDYWIKDIALSEWGRREITLAEAEMPGLLSLREEYRGESPLSGARIAGCLHMTVQTAVLIETLLSLGAKVRWASCNIFSTQDHAAAAVAARGVPVFAWKEESEASYWECIERTLFTPKGEWYPNLLLDDGGDLSEHVHCKYAEHLPALQGVSEETTTGVHRLEQRAAAGTLGLAVFNVNDSVSKSKFDNTYGCRESLVDSIRRATDLMLSGKRALVCGYGNVGKGSAESLRRAGCRVSVTEIDPLCALQAAMEGFEVDTLEALVDKVDIIVTATGNCDVVTLEHMRAMKQGAVLCNIGHFDNEICVSDLRSFRWERVKPQVDEIVFPDGKRIVLLAEGRLVNLGCGMGHPSFVMSTSFTNQVLAQIELWQNASRYEKKVYLLPRHLDEKVARLHLSKLGARLSTLTQQQADYIHVKREGPYKSDSYRY